MYFADEPRDATPHARPADLPLFLPRAPVSRQPEHTGLGPRLDPLRPTRGARIARRTAEIALAATWRALTPDSPERFARPPHRPLLARLYYATDDGWRCPLFHLPAPPGTRGEPVLLAHGLAVNRFAMDLTAELSIAQALHEAGFAVYLLEHRLDRSAIAPDDARPGDLDDLVAQDVPAALEAIQHHSGFPRVAWVGHALGGQLLYAYLASYGRLGLGPATTLCAPVRFEAGETMLRAAALLELLLPRGAHVPMRAAAALAAPSAGANELTRSLMVHGAENLSGAMVRQVLTWLRAGTLTDRHDRIDYLAALAGHTLPVQVIACEGDPTCRPHHAGEVLAKLAGPVDGHVLDSTWSHLDPLLDSRAPTQVFGPVVTWLDRHRQLCW